MIELKANGNYLQCSKTELLTSGAQKVFSCSFALDERWNGLTPTAVFLAGGIEREHTLDKDGTSPVPWEVLQHPGHQLYVGVYGSNADGVVLPTIWCSVGMIRKGAGPSDPSEEPTPRPYDQLLSAVGALPDLKTEDKSSLVAAVNELVGAGGVNVTGAEVGQVIQVAEVNEAGKPTKWEPVDMPEQVQDDWSQSDPTATDYVKNRTHYEYEEHYDLAENPVFTAGGSSDSFVLSTVPAVGDLVFLRIESDTISLSWSFVYDGTSAEHNSAESAYYRAYIVGDEMYVAVAGSTYWPSYTITSCYATRTAVKTIDPKYLPDSVKTLVVTITQADDGTYSADHTFAEISAAIEAGRDVVAKLDVGLFLYIPLTTWVHDNFVLFSAVDAELRLQGVLVGVDNSIDRASMRLAMANNIWTPPTTGTTGQVLTKTDSGEEWADSPSGGSYTLPTATADTLGGIKADPAEETDTQPVRIGADGKMYTAPVTDDHINSLIDTKLGVIENGSY